MLIVARLPNRLPEGRLTKGVVMQYHAMASCLGVMSCNAVALGCSPLRGQSENKINSMDIPPPHDPSK